MVTINDVAAALMTRFAAATGYSAAVPGGTWFNRGPDTPADYPYTVFTIEAQDPLLTLEAAYFQDFIVTATAFCPVGDSGTNVATVEQVLFTALGSDAANTAFTSASLRNSGEAFIDCELAIPSEDYAEPLSSARDVAAARLSVRLTARGDRSLA